MAASSTRLGGRRCCVVNHDGDTSRMIVMAVDSSRHEEILEGTEYLLCEKGFRNPQNKKSVTKLPLTYCLPTYAGEGTKREEQTLDDTRYGSLMNDYYNTIANGRPYLILSNGLKRIFVSCVC
eukprot:scaffold5118_cov38-Cyclotella_meneghiniana.AAC.2